MSTLINRLRFLDDHPCYSAHVEAADELTRLAAENAALKGLLQRVSSPQWSTRTWDGGTMVDAALLAEIDAALTKETEK